MNEIDRQKHLFMTYFNCRHLNGHDACIKSHASKTRGQLTRTSFTENLPVTRIIYHCHPDHRLSIVTMCHNTACAEQYDRGYAWVIVCIGVMASFMKSATYCLFGVVFLDLKDYFDTNKSSLVLVGGLMDFFLGFTSILYGPLVARYGGRSVGLLCCGFVSTAYILTIYCQQLWQLHLCYGVLLGCATASYSPVAISSVCMWFRKKRSLAVSLALAGISSGSFIWPPFLTWLTNIYSWKGAFLIVAGIQMHAFIFFALLRSNKAQLQRSTSGDNGNRLHCSVNMENLPPSHADKEKKSPSISAVANIKNEDMSTAKREYSLFSWLEIVKDPLYILFLVGQFLMNIGYTLPFTYTVPRAVMLGHSKINAALLASIMGIAGAVSRIVIGLIGDYLPIHRRLFACGLSASLVGVLGILSMLCDDFWFLAAYSILFAVFSAVYGVYIVTAIPDFFGFKYISERIGFNMACAGVGYLTGNLLAGVMWDKINQPSLPFAVLGGGQIIGGLCIIICVFIHMKQTTNTHHPDDDI